MVPVEALVLYIYFLNIVLMWKIVVPAEASVLYIYIDKDRHTQIRLKGTYNRHQNRIPTYPNLSQRMGMIVG